MRVNIFISCRSRRSDADEEKADAVMQMKKKPTQLRKSRRSDALFSL